MKKQRRIYMVAGLHLTLLDRQGYGDGELPLMHVALAPALEPKIPAQVQAFPEQMDTPVNIARRS